MTKASRFSSTRLLVQAFCTLLLFLPSSAQTLTAPSNLEGLDDEDREALEVIATRDEAVRDAALVASGHVDLLVEVQRIQEQSSARFQETIEEQPEELRDMIWDLVRVPGLLEELGTDGPRSGSELDAIVVRHPKELEAAIRTLGRSHYGLLGEMLRIDRVAWDRFDVLVEDLPEDSKEALRTLVNEPELLSILARRVRLAVYLGDSYRDDPEATRRHLAELGTEVALRDAAAEEEWRTAMESDAGAGEDLERSARFYADEYGYDYDELTDYEVTSVRTVVYHYPYWFGYPTRYANHYLYPYGYWYTYPVQLGFYYGGGHHGNGHHKVYYGVPSGHYLHWYFGNHHDRHYKNLSHRFSKHQDTHRYAGDYRYRTLSYWDKHKDSRNRHGDWRRGGRDHPRDGWQGRTGRNSGRHGERRFVRDRRDDGLAARFTSARERGRRNSQGRDGEARTRRSSQPDARADKVGRQRKRAGRDRQPKTRRSERKRKAEARRERIPTETRPIQKRERNAGEFREARASRRETREVRSASRAQRRVEKTARKATRRGNTQTRKAARGGTGQIRKASHSSPRKARAAKASSRRSQKVASARRSGHGGRSHGRRR